jgi:orotidine-5'-phosphate decarboxylase
MFGCSLIFFLAEKPEGECVMMGFRKKLAERQTNAKSLVCVGLDPLLEKIPKRIEGQKASLAMDVEMWMSKIAHATGEYASMFKLQSAHWEAIPGGVEALGNTIDCIHRMFPDIPVFLDCKRGDIARTQQQYRIAHFDLQGADGINFSPYMGRDCMSALVDKNNLGRALVGLCYTSNPDARQVQDLWVPGAATGGSYLWQYFARWILQWAEELGVVENAGLVMAAAYKPKDATGIYSQHLTCCREMVGNKLWFLIPGIGAQGGFIEETVRTAYDGSGSIAINSSSEIDFASSGTDFAEAAAKKACELRDAINNALVA